MNETRPGSLSGEKLVVTLGQTLGVKGNRRFFGLAQNYLQAEAALSQLTNQRNAELSQFSDDPSLTQLREQLEELSAQQKLIKSPSGIRPATISRRRSIKPLVGFISLVLGIPAAFVTCDAIGKMDSPKDQADDRLPIYEEGSKIGDNYMIVNAVRGLNLEASSLAFDQVMAVIQKGRGLPLDAAVLLILTNRIIDNHQSYGNLYKESRNVSRVLFHARNIDINDITEKAWKVRTAQPESKTDKQVVDAW